MGYLLHHLLIESAQRFPDRRAIVYRDRSLTYSEVDALSDRVAAMLRFSGVAPGDRVGIYVQKSPAALISMFGVLKAGACYVPLDSGAPLERTAYIVRDSGISVLLTNSSRLGRLEVIFREPCPLHTVILVDCDPDTGHYSDASRIPVGISVIPWRKVLAEAASPPGEAAIETDTAYILYTSGSTGSPKGVMISHRNSLTFVVWAGDSVGLTETDTVSSHAPLHFDLSVFDVYSTCRAGAAIVLIPDGSTTFPRDLGHLIERERISVWYSVPSALTLLVLYGNLSALDLSSLRTVIFAGEVFPVKYLRRLMTEVPGARYLNWYGPTETNVCTAFEVPPLDPDRTAPVPIGRACANTDTFVVDSAGRIASSPGDIGELYVRGPSLMQGYWGDPEKTATRLIHNPFQSHFIEYVYRTGDIVRISVDGNYVYVGREDGMIKTRGYRVESGEIEAALYEHPAIKEAAILPVHHDVFGNLLRAVISLNEGCILAREDVLDYCAQRLPRYMVPEVVEIWSELPKTSTGKTDRAALASST